MLHRRNTSSQPGASTSQSAPPPPSSSSVKSPAPPLRNTAYTPLRRGSSGLYNTPSSAPKARYDLPSPSPGGPQSYPYASSYPSLGLNTPSGGLGYGAYEGRGGAGGVYDLTDDGLGSVGGGSEWPKGKDEWLEKIREGLERLKRGLEDASKLDRSWSLVWGDRELRNLVIKSTLINLVSLLLLSLSPIILSTSSSSSLNARNRTESVGFWYNILLTWPVFVVCFWINASWAPDISKRAQTLLHPSYRHQPTATSSGSSGSSSSSSFNITTQLFTAVQRLLLISDFTLVSRLILMIPLIGRPASFAYMCIIDAYYFFDSTFNSKGWGLDRKITFMQERTAYMIGFGFIATLITSFGPQLVSMAIFALIYPFFVIQAQLSRPPTPKNSLLPSTPSPGASIPSSPDGVQVSPFFTGSHPTFSVLSGSGSLSVSDLKRFEPKVPIFFFARYALFGLGWLEEALGRDRGVHRRGLGGKERPGKRLG